MTLAAKDENLQIEKFELGPFGTNTYILTCRKTNACVVVDAPGEADKILGQLKGMNAKYILMTHNHMDHTGSLAELKAALNVPVAAHAADADRLPIPCDKLLKDGDTIAFGEIRLDVLFTPGHTPGSLSFHTANYLISGDTLFPGGPGKTGTPADFRTIIESLTQKIFLLPGDTQIFPGHGVAAILKKEKQAFEAFSAKPKNPDLCGDVLWASA